MTSKINLDMVEGLTAALAAKAPLADNATDTDVTAAIAAAVAALPPVTPWVAYTPTILGVGTPTGVLFRSRRVGNTLEVVGRFTSGTSTAVTMSVTLGHAGVDGGLTVAALQSSRGLVGHTAYNVSSASAGTVLALGGDAFVTFGLQTAAAGGLNPGLGNNLNSSGNVMAMFFSVPITGW